MTVYIVMWEDEYEPSEIIDVFASKESADTLALKLNIDALQQAVEDSYTWAKKALAEGPKNGRYGPYATAEDVKNSLNWINIKYYFLHSVLEWEVKP
jgi:hypothetical protein